MNFDEVKTMLSKKGHAIVKVSNLRNNSGTRLDLSRGQVVNLFKTGRISVQGKGAQIVQELLKTVEYSPASESAVKSSKVFVVFGRDNDAKRGVELILRRWNLDPVILDQLPSKGMTVIEKLENYVEHVGYGVVLATPDDEGHRRGAPSEKLYRARQNVILELGMLLQKLGRKRVAILIKDQKNMERPSDIQGLVYIPFKEDIEEVQIPLAKEMNAQGYLVDISQLRVA